MQGHNWNLYFGPEVDEDLDIICGFTKGRSATAYQGVVVGAAYDEITGFQQIHFPVMHASTLFGTADQSQQQDYISLRLDNLVCTASAHTTINYWVKRDFAGLPFLQQKIKTLKIDMDAAPAERTKRKKRGSRNAVIASSSDEDHEANHPAKTSKPANTTAPLAHPRMNKAQAKTHELMQQMRNTPM